MYTGAWVLSFTNIIDFYIKPHDYLSFVAKYQFSRKYAFHVYHTPDCYLIFCVSHLRTPRTNLIKFLMSGMSSMSYNLLAHKWNCFVILNSSYNAKHRFDFDFFDHVTTLGMGEVNLQIVNIIHFIRQLKTHYKTLPEHFLMI